MLFAKIIKEFRFPAAIFLAHIILIYLFDIYRLLPWFDIPMHFLGGLAVAFTFFSIIKILQKNHYLGKINNIALFIFVISLVALTATLWEFFEFIVDFILALRTQASLEDTMLDLLLGLIGGISGFLIKSRFQINANNYKSNLAL